MTNSAWFVRPEPFKVSAEPYRPTLRYAKGLGPVRANDILCDECGTSREFHGAPELWVIVIDVTVTDLCIDCKANFTWSPEDWRYNPLIRAYVSNRKVQW